MKNKLFMLLSILLTVLLLTGILAHTVLAADGEPETQSETNETILGDVNDDGVTNTSDVVKMVEEYFTPTADYDFCDQTGDGKVTLIDILRVVKSAL